MSIESAALLWALFAFAEPHQDAGARPVPVYVEAGEVQYLTQEKRVIFLGNPLVRVQREDATLVCRKLVVQNDDQGEVDTADCFGEVRFDRGDQVVTCDTATFKNGASRVICRGRPVVVREGASIGRGDELTYDIVTGKAVMVGKPVSGVLNRKSGQSFRSGSAPGKDGGK